MADPKERRYVPGSDPVPADQQVPEWPSDSAAWMNVEPRPYEGDEPLFPDESDETVATKKVASEEATDG